MRSSLTAHFNNTSTSGTLVVVSVFLRQVNKGRHSSCYVVPYLSRDDVVRFLLLLAHHGFESTLRRIMLRYWWPLIRGDVSAFVRVCEVNDQDRFSNPNPRR